MNSGKEVITLVTGNQKKLQEVISILGPQITFTVSYFQFHPTKNLNCHASVVPWKKPSWAIQSKP